MKDLGYMNSWGTEIPKELKEALAKGYEITDEQMAVIKKTLIRRMRR